MGGGEGVGGREGMADGRQGGSGERQRWQLHCLSQALAHREDGSEAAQQNTQKTCQEDGRLG